MFSEIESIDQLSAALAAGTSLRHQRWQDLDLTTVEAHLLARQDLRGVAVFGGRYSPELAEHMSRSGAWIFPSPDEIPVDPYRARLYTPAELYSGLESGYQHTPDYAGYQWARATLQERDPLATAMQAIHDDGMSEALTERLPGHPVVGIMGGHAAARTDATFRAAAVLALRLREHGLTVVTGGGPGAMEAGNLGASCRDEAQLDIALTELAVQPTWQDGIGPWARDALALRDRLELDCSQSISVPTWFYGHEPPNVFASGIAKYFSNALREDILLSCATAGVVVLPGAAGTVQEVFQLITRLYYAADDEPVPPLVLVGADYWTHRLPVAPLAQALATGRRLAGALHVAETPAEAASIVLDAHAATSGGSSPRLGYV